MKTNMNRANALRNQILQARHVIYYRGESLISDAEYDALEDELRRMSPDDPVLALVGSPVAADSLLTKARHVMPMGSQGKVNSAQAFRDWCARAVSREIGGGAVESLALNLSLKAFGPNPAKSSWKSVPLWIVGGKKLRFDLLRVSLSECSSDDGDSREFNH